MTWTKLGESFADDPDLLSVPRGVRHMHVEALVWCNKHGTDGHVPRHVLARITDEPDVDAAAASLVQAGLWEAVDDGWQIVNFTEDQPSAADVEKTQVYARERQRKQRQHRNGDHSLCDPRYCRAAVTRDSRVSHNTRTDPSVPTRTEGTEVRGGDGDEPGAGAPARAANGDGEASRVGLPDRCPHGTHHGLDLRAGSLICPTCTMVAPPGYDDPDAIRKRITSCIEAGFSVDVAWETYLVATEHHAKVAEAVARAVYRHLGGQFDTQQECVDQDLFAYLQAFCLQNLDLEYVPKAVYRLQVSNA